VTTLYRNGIQRRKPFFAKRHSMAVNGSFRHVPKADAMHHPTHEILPRVRAVDAGVGFKIVGHGWDRVGWLDLVHGSRSSVCSMI
jgi:hypothetical protein